MAGPCIDGTAATELRIIGANLQRYDIVGCPAPYSLTPGGTARAMTPYRIQSKTVGVDIPGEIVTNIRAEPRAIVCPIVIHGTTETELDDAIGGLGGFLSTIEGICRLVWTRADGTRREIGAHYQSGADTIRITNLAGHRHAEARLVFVAHFPYWQTWGSTGTAWGGGFLDAQSAGISHFDFTNNGDVRTWPDIQLTGPCERIELGNVSTGQMFRVREILSAGQVLRIETDPRNRGVYLDDVWRPDVLDPTAADLWPLLPGLNRTVFRAISPGGAGQWRIAWTDFFETP